MNFIQLLSARIKSESPEFFKKIRKYSAWITASCIAILVSKQFLVQYGFIFPQDMVQYLGYTICICAGICGTTFLTTTNTDLAQK